MAKQIIKNYVFNATSKTVTMSDFSTVALERLQLIVDTTTNTILYNFADSSIATATVATNVITLSTVGTAASADKLQIIYDSATGDPRYDGGQTTMANARPVVIASDQSSLPVKGGYVEQASLIAAALNADLVPSTDVSAYKTFSIQVTTIATGGTLTFQHSHDGTNWYNTLVTRPSVPTAAPFNTTTAADIYVGPVMARYLRIRQTAWTSGSSTGILELYTMPYPAHVIGGVVGLTGTSSVNVAQINGGTAGATSASALASAARTVTTSSADISNTNWRGIRMVLNVTAASGTGGLTLQAQGKELIAGGYYAINVAPTAVTATGLYVYDIYPGSNGNAAAAILQKTDSQVPKTFRITATHADASSYTYSVSYDGLI